jgi:hypothetical protein
MNRLPRLLALVPILLVAVAGCALKKEAPPLPGDSVSEDGAVRLSPRGTVIAQPTSAMPSPAANGPGEAPSREPLEPLGAIEARVFAPELVMEHQAALALAPDQLAAVQKEVERGQVVMLKVQWELAREKEKLAALLDADGGKVDEAKAAAAAAELMKREDAIKGAHLAMLVRVKNQLTAAQQAKLRDLRDEARRGR